MSNEIYYTKKGYKVDIDYIDRQIDYDEFVEGKIFYKGSRNFNTINDFDFKYKKDDCYYDYIQKDLLKEWNELKSKYWLFELFLYEHDSVSISNSLNVLKFDKNFDFENFDGFFGYNKEHFTLNEAKKACGRDCEALKNRWNGWLFDAIIYKPVKFKNLETGEIKEFFEEIGTSGIYMDVEQLKEDVEKYIDNNY